MAEENTIGKYGRHLRKCCPDLLRLFAGVSITVLTAFPSYAQTTQDHVTTTTPVKKHVVARKSARKTHVTPHGTPSSARRSSPSKASPASSMPSVTQDHAQKRDDLYGGKNADAIEQVTVTGTRLSQTRLTNVMAGTTLDADQLKARGYTNLGLALLRENPAFSVPSNSQIGSQNSWGAGQTFTGLLALGEQRTLTLINGMRMVGGATASIYGAGTGSQVDVGTIPTSLIKKIDTKYGGAGAAYGADAVAGVVNYELDDHFTGVDFSAQGDWTQKLDAPQEKIYFKAGTTFDHGKGGLVFDVEYRNAGGMVYNDRRNLIGSNSETYLWPALDSTSPYSYVLTRNERYIQVNASGIPLLNGYQNPSLYGAARGGIAAPGGGALQFSKDGKSLIPITGALVQSNYYAAGGNGMSFEDYDQLFTPSSSLNLTHVGHYDFSDHLHATWQAWYQRGEAKSTISDGYWSSAMFDAPLNMDNYLNSSNVNGALTLRTDNPYLTDAERSTIVNALAAKGLPTDQFYMARDTHDLREGMFTTTNQMFRFQGGLNGDFNAVGRHFEWNVRGEYSRYMNSTATPMVVTQNLINALDAVRLPDGSIGCAPGVVNSTAPTVSKTCASLNLFGENQASPAAIDYTTAIAKPKNANSQRDLQAEIHSTVVHLPAGDVRWDIGYEHRREAYNFDSGAALRGEQLADGSYRQYGDDIPIPNTGGAYHTHEVFGELDVPLISPNMHMPAAYSLSATANGRYINNNMAGGYWTYMFGGAWWPTQDFGFSGNYARSVRNPSVTELFAPKSRVANMASDPCSQEDLANGPDPATRQANCAREGIPSNFESNIVNYTVFGTNGGNPHLKNEVSTSYTGSAHFVPRFVPGLQLDASFVDVKISNEITSLGISSIMAACYDSKDFPNAYCNLFTRDADHQVTSYEEGYVNIAGQHMQALEAALNYNLPLRRINAAWRDFGEFNLSVNYNHYVKNTTSYLGTSYQGFGGTGQPQDSFTANLNYMRGPLTLQWQTIYYGPSQFGVQAGKYAQNYNDRPDFAYFNATIGYRITKNFDVNFMINNATNAVPRYAGTTSLGRYYDAMLGRAFQLQLGAHF